MINLSIRICLPFQGFQTACHEFVLDLIQQRGRYPVHSCSHHVAPNRFRKTMCTLEYNEKQRPQNINIALNSSLIRWANLNLQTFYVLNRTSASAPTVINT
jgi:hypothetical protein